MAISALIYTGRRIDSTEGPYDQGFNLEVSLLLLKKLSVNQVFVELII